MVNISRIPSKAGHVRGRTLTARIEHDLRDSIRDRTKYLPGNRLPPLRELADDFGVSHSTVDEALRNLEVDGWLERKGGRGVRVAKELPHRVVAFVSEEEAGAWGSSVAEQLALDGINSVLKDHEYRTHLFGVVFEGYELSQVNRPTLEDMLGLADRGLLSGVIFRGNAESVPGFVGSPEEIGAALSGYALVRLEAKPVWNEPCVGVDEEEIIKVQVKYLVEQGCNRIAIFVSSAESTKERLEAKVSVFARELRAAGKSFNEDLVLRVAIEDNADSKYGYGVFDHIFYRRFREFWERVQGGGACPDGMMITDDIAARSAAFGLLAEGVDVPGDLMVSACSNKGSGVYIPLPFGRCEIDASRLGKEAASLILRQINGDAVEGTEVLIKPRMIGPMEWAIQ